MATTYYRPPSAFYSSVNDIFGRGFNVVPPQAALGAGVQPLALGPASQAVLGGAPPRLALGPGAVANQLAGQATGRLGNAASPFVAENMVGNQFGQAAGRNLLQTQVGSGGGVRGLLRSARGGLKGKIGPAIGYPILGQIGASGVRQVFSDSPQAATAPWENALKFGGIGAGIGSVVPGAGTLIGGLAGAAVGTGMGIFGGGDVPAPPVLKKRDRPRFQLNELMRVNKVPKPVREEARDVYSQSMQRQMARNKNKPIGIKKSLRMQTKAAQKAVEFLSMGGAEAATAESGLAAQALAANFLGPLIARQQQEADAYANIQNSIAGQLPPEYAGLAQLDASNTRLGAAQTNAAYAAQIAAMPGQKAMEESLARQKQIEQQAFAASLQQPAASGEGLDDLVPEGLK